MGDVHTLPYPESPLLERPIDTWAGPVPHEIMSVAIRRLRHCGIRLTTARLLNDDARACYSSLLGVVAGLEWANQQLKQVARDQAERIAQLESRLLAMEGEK